MSPSGLNAMSYVLRSPAATSSHVLPSLSVRATHPPGAQIAGHCRKAARGNRREVVTKVLEGIRRKLKSAGTDGIDDNGDPTSTRGGGEKASHWDGKDAVVELEP